MRTVAIAGVGLIGGSFALALRAAGFTGDILGVSSPGAIEQALKLGAIDRGATLEDAAAVADLVYLAQPILRIMETIDRLAACLKPGALVTDAGSTKARIAERARRALPPGAFLGGHPMAGKEVRGVAAADAKLFAGRAYVLTPFEPAALGTPAAQMLVAWIRKIGASILVMTPEEHDSTVAFTSHVPQLASTALSLLVADHVSGERLSAAGPGLMDMSRLAMSAYDIWADILATNDAIPQALEAYIAVLERLRGELLEPPMQNEFQRAGALARRLRDFRPE